MPVTIEDLEDAYTLDEVAQRLRVHPETARRIVRRGDLEAIRIGEGRGRWYVTRRALTEYLNQRRSTVARSTSM